MTRQRNTHPHEIPICGRQGRANCAIVDTNPQSDHEVAAVSAGRPAGCAQLRQLRQERALRAKRTSTVCAQSFPLPAPAISRLTSHRLKRKCPGTVAGLRSVARKTTPHGHPLPDDRTTAWTTSVYLFRTLTICSRAQIVVLRQMLSPHASRDAAAFLSAGALLLWG